MGRIFSISDTFGLNFAENGSDLTMNISGSGMAVGSSDYIAWAASGFANTVVDRQRSAVRRPAFWRLALLPGAQALERCWVRGIDRDRRRFHRGGRTDRIRATTAAATNCISLATACLVINVAGMTRYVPYY